MVTLDIRTTASHACGHCLLWLSSWNDKNNINDSTNKTFIYVGSHLILGKFCKLGRFPRVPDENTEMMRGDSSEKSHCFCLLNAELRTKSLPGASVCERSKPRAGTRSWELWSWCGSHHFVSLMGECTPAPGGFWAFSLHVTLPKQLSWGHMGRKGP